jgi:hypothetical protein
VVVVVLHEQVGVAVDTEFREPNDVGFATQIIDQLGSRLAGFESADHGADVEMVTKDPDEPLVGKVLLDVARIGW